MKMKPMVMRRPGKGVLRVSRSKPENTTKPPS